MSAGAGVLLAGCAASPESNGSLAAPATVRVPPPATSAAVLRTAASSKSRGAPDGLRLLQRAQEASGKTDYQGVMESQFASDHGWLKMHLLVHCSRSRATRFEYLDGPQAGLVVLKRSGSVWRYNAHGGHVVFSSAPPPSLDTWQVLLQKNYQTAVRSGARIADRDALQVDVMPRSPENHRSRYWVDSRTGIVLGQDRFGEGNRLVSSSRFHSIRFAEQPASLFKPPRSAIMRTPVQTGKPMALAQLQRKVGFPLVTPRFLPRGFRPAGNYLTVCEDGCDAPVAMTRFTNGMDTFTLFQSSHMTERPGECLVRSSGSAHEVRLARQHTDYVVVGDMKVDQLKKIVLSIVEPPVPPLSSTAAH